ncbi:MAG: redoxin domain-containing protein [Deltaproteobacteria bacterium]|nr:redoxin domain-containing protein [Deltaproteobacteria bacterium]MBW2243272.1 redoxin domain-containing protein [Deltaproteobacteria bacterium]
MANYAEQMAEFASRDVKVIAASVDPLGLAEQLSSKLDLDFRLGYGLDKEEIASATGAFYEAKGNFEAGRAGFLHATGFILDDEGKVRLALYSTGAIGRLTPQDCLGYIDAFKGVPLGELPGGAT